MKAKIMSGSALCAFLCLAIASIAVWGAGGLAVAFCTIVAGLLFLGLSLLTEDVLLHDYKMDSNDWFWGTVCVIITLLCLWCSSCVGGIGGFAISACGFPIVVLMRLCDTWLYAFDRTQSDNTVWQHTFDKAVPDCIPIRPVKNELWLNMPCCPLCGERRLTKDIHRGRWTFVCGFSQDAKSETLCQGKRFLRYIEGQFGRTCSPLYSNQG